MGKAQYFDELKPKDEVDPNPMDMSKDKSIFDDMTKNIKNSINLNDYFLNLSKSYNCDIKHIVKKYINYLIRNKEIKICSEFLNFVENILHLDDFDIEDYINYFLEKMKTFIN